MLPYWQNRNDRMAAVLMSYPMRDMDVPEHALRYKHWLWDKCVWWGEPVRSVDDGRRSEAAAAHLQDRDGGGAAVSQSDREGQA
jgi:hypothetical protein